MKQDDRVRVVSSGSFYLACIAHLSKKGTIIRHEPSARHMPMTVVQLDTGEQFAFYDDEIELMPAGEQEGV